MKLIGIDARFYGEAGPGRYVKNIISHLENIDSENKYYIFLRKKGFEDYNPKNPNFIKVLADYKWYSFEEQIFFLLKLLSFRLDLFYIPHFNIPVFYPGKIVTAIPDIIMHSFSTEEGTTLPKFYYRFKKKIYYLVVLIALLRSEKVIVPSNDTKNDFLKNYKFILDSKYVLAYEGVDPDLLKSDLNSESVLKKYGIKKPFLLYISSMYKHKNVERLVEMFEILKSKFGFSGQLVLVGKKDTFSSAIQKLVALKGMNNSVLMPGMQNYVSDSEAIALRKEAALFVFPSLKEGFSLTPLEAMAMSLPCAVSKIPCHEEVLGDAAWYFDPLDTSDMAEKVHKLLEDTTLRENLIKKGLEKVKEYNWNDTAKVTLRVFSDTFKNI